MYIQPQSELTELALMQIVCASGEFEETDEAISGQAPKRRTPAF